MSTLSSGKAHSLVRSVGRVGNAALASQVVPLAGDPL